MTVLSRKIPDGFSYCHSNPGFCNYMSDSIITVHGRESSPTHTGDLSQQLVLLYAKSWSDEEPRKTCHIYTGTD